MTPLAAIRAVVRGAQLAAAARQWPELAEVLGDAIAMLDEAEGERGRERQRGRTRRSARASTGQTPDADTRSLSLFLDQDQREQREGATASQKEEGTSGERGGASDAELRVDPCEGMDGGQPGDSSASRAPLSLPSVIPKRLLAIAEAHHLADPQQSFGVYRVHRNGQGSEQDWTAWCLRERNRAPPESTTRLRAVPDVEKREREQREAHEALRRSRAGPELARASVATILAAVAPHPPKAQGE